MRDGSASQLIILGIKQLVFRLMSDDCLRRNLAMARASAKARNPPKAAVCRDQADRVETVADG
jgi:hypothetical protein